MVRVASLVFVVSSSFASGCYGFNAPQGGGSVDAAAPCSPWQTRGGHIAEPCTAPPGGAWKITADVTYDTDTGTSSDGRSPRSILLAQPGLPALRVLSVDSFEIVDGATLRAVGELPLLVLSWSTISVAGTLDVGSRRGVGRGAGGSRQACPLAGDGQGASNAGGGGGGGFNLGGASGGDGNTGGAVNGSGAGGGSTTRPSRAVLGGCRGGNGGGAGGQGGEAGGALQLTARSSITILGRIRAGGMGGAGASGNGGGGGAGSGGYVGLDAPEVSTTMLSIIAANSGGGGAGCQSGMGAAGEDALDANTRALGGMGTSCVSGAAGGDGGRRGDAPGAGASSMFSGGGGGGGVGNIIVWAPTGAFMKDGLQTPPEVHVTAIE